MRVLWSALGATLAAAALGCAHVPRLPAAIGAPEPDSATVALWHMDERTGTTVADAGPNRLHGTAGRATQTPYGRYGLCRGFISSYDSFVFVPFDQALDVPEGLTIEAWIYPKALGRDEDTPIVGRWTEDPGQQSWLLSLGGHSLTAPVNVDPSPGYHLGFFNPPAPGHLWFVFQPAAAGPPRAFVSVAELELNRWTHIAVTFDGEEVRMYLDGVLDSQFASAGRIRASTAPLLMGNYFDPRTLSRFSGDLSPEVLSGATPFYAYQGLIDELRLSSESRRTFPRR